MVQTHHPDVLACVADLTNRVVVECAPKVKKPKRAAAETFKVKKPKRVCLSNKSKMAIRHHNKSLNKWGFKNWRLAHDFAAKIKVIEERVASEDEDSDATQPFESGSSSEDEDLANPKPLEDVEVGKVVQEVRKILAPVPPAFDPPADPPKVKKIASIPTRFTQEFAPAPLDFTKVCDFTNRCCCRAWTPTHTATGSKIKDRKTTFGGGCSKSVGVGSTSIYELCDRWYEHLNDLATECEDSSKARLYEDSAKFWHTYPSWLDGQFTKKFGACETTWATKLKVCGTHSSALSKNVRTFGELKPPNKKGVRIGHPLILGLDSNRGPNSEDLAKGDYGVHIQFNEQGFIWENPTKMVFYSWEGSSGSCDTKAQQDNLWTKEDHAEALIAEDLYGKSKAGWRIKNYCMRNEYPEMSGRWQEQGWSYLN